MPKTVQEGFNTFHGWLVPTDTQRSNGASHRASVKAALESRLDVFNFFETGSFSHGTGVRGRSDIDALVSLRSEKPAGTYTALQWVQDALKARFPKTPVEIRRPAVVVRFAGGYETWEVIPGFLTGGKSGSHLVYSIPGPGSGDPYIKSAPKAHLDYVNESNKVPVAGKAKRLARFIKAWKYYRNVPVSSFYLEMRCAQHVRTQNAYSDIWDVCQILEKLDGHGLAAMNDPAEEVGRIEACSTDAKREDAKSKLARAAGRARKALDAHNANRPDDAFYYLDQLFGGQFPSR
jgi:hypothetical protein